MRNQRAAVSLVFFVLGLGRALGGEQEIGLTLGAISTPSRTVTGGKLDFSAGTALQANYARTLASLHYISLMGEIHFLASPQEQITSNLTAATKDIAVLYLTPGIRVKLLPKSKLSPWGSVGGGYSLYEQSTTTIAGAPNGAPRHVSGGALQFGGGVDYKIFPLISLRAEVREFYTGSAKFNLPVNGSGQFNTVAGGGIVFRLGH
jgi:hypothetical protein